MITFNTDLIDSFLFADFKNLKILEFFIFDQAEKSIWVKITSIAAVKTHRITESGLCIEVDRESYQMNFLPGAKVQKVLASIHLQCAKKPDFEDDEA